MNYEQTLHKKPTYSQGENDEERCKFQAWQDHSQGTICFLLQREGKYLLLGYNPAPQFYIVKTN